MTDLEKEYLNNIITAGWFQWYDLENRIEYPECHVLIYKSDDNFLAEVLDFPIMAFGDSIDESFQNLTKLSKNYLDQYRQTIHSGGVFNYKSSESEFWNKFREIYSPMKMQNFLNTDRSNKKSFPFDLYDSHQSLQKENLKLNNTIQNLIENNTYKNLTIENLQSQNNSLNKENKELKIQLAQHLVEVNHFKAS